MSEIKAVSLVQENERRAILGAFQHINFKVLDNPQASKIFKELLNGLIKNKDKYNQENRNLIFKLCSTFINFITMQYCSDFLICANSQILEFSGLIYGENRGKDVELKKILQDLSSYLDANISFLKQIFDNAAYEGKEGLAQEFVNKKLLQSYIDKVNILFSAVEDIEEDKVIKEHFKELLLNQYKEVIFTILNQLLAKKESFVKEYEAELKLINSSNLVLEQTNFINGINILENFREINLLASIAKAIAADSKITKLCPGFKKRFEAIEYDRFASLIHQIDKIFVISSLANKNIMMWCFASFSSFFKLLLEQYLIHDELLAKLHKAAEKNCSTKEEYLIFCSLKKDISYLEEIYIASLPKKHHLHREVILIKDKVALKFIEFRYKTFIDFAKHGLVYKNAVDLIVSYENDFNKEVALIKDLKLISSINEKYSIGKAIDLLALHFFGLNKFPEFQLFSILGVIQKSQKKDFGTENYDFLKKNSHFILETKSFDVYKKHMKELEEKYKRFTSTEVTKAPGYKILLKQNIDKYNNYKICLDNTALKISNSNNNLNSDFKNQFIRYSEPNINQFFKANNQTSNNNNFEEIKKTLANKYVIGSGSYNNVKDTNIERIISENKSFFEPDQKAASNLEQIYNKIHEYSALMLIQDLNLDSKLSLKLRDIIKNSKVFHEQIILEKAFNNIEQIIKDIFYNYIRESHLLKFTKIFLSSIENNNFTFFEQISNIVKYCEECEKKLEKFEVVIIEKLLNKSLLNILLVSLQEFAEKSSDLLLKKETYIICYFFEMKNYLEDRPSQNIKIIKMLKECASSINSESQFGLVGFNYDIFKQIVYNRINKEITGNIDNVQEYSNDTMILRDQIYNQIFAEYEVYGHILPKGYFINKFNQFFMIMLSRSDMKDRNVLFEYIKINPAIKFCFSKMNIDFENQNTICNQLKTLFKTINTNDMHYFSCFSDELYNIYKSNNFSNIAERLINCFKLAVLTDVPLDSSTYQINKENKINEVLEDNQEFIKWYQDNGLQVSTKVEKPYDTFVIIDAYKETPFMEVLDQIMHANNNNQNYSYMSKIGSFFGY